MDYPSSAACGMVMMIMIKDRAAGSPWYVLSRRNSTCSYSQSGVEPGLRTFACLLGQIRTGKPLEGRSLLTQLGADPIRQRFREGLGGMARIYCLLYTL
jgi:hypothetical protein